MKLLSYKTEDSISELTNLCIKLLKHNKTITIRVEDIDQAQKLSESFWKSYYFLPHGIEGEEFAHIQPIILTINNIKRDIFINFENTYSLHTDLDFNLDSLIQWNCEPYQGQFENYIQDSTKKWKKVN